MLLMPHTSRVITWSWLHAVKRLLVKRHGGFALPLTVIWNVAN